jgi:hypothetical protein
MASIYWATFTSEYLESVRNEPIARLKKWEPKVQVKHTKRYNLYITEERTEFIKQIIALFRFVAAGEANIGHVRKCGSEIHRRTDESGILVDEPVERPPQRAMDEKDEMEFMETSGFKSFAS